MTTQFTTDPTDQFRETIFSVKEQWRLVPSWRVAVPAAGALAVIGMASALHFAGSTVDEPPASVAASVAMSAQAAIAPVMDAPAVQSPPAEIVEPRAGRIDRPSALEAKQELIQLRIVALRDDDPRWGRATAAGEKAEANAPEPIETAELRSKLERLQDPAPADESPVASVANKPEPTDATSTGAIPARAADQPAPAGEAVSAVEPAPVAAVQPAPAVEAVSALQDEPEPAVTNETSEPRTAKVTKYVNMRAGPENEAAVLTVVPAGGSVKVIGCDMWCEIDFDGRRGWVFKSFIAGS